MLLHLSQENTKTHKHKINNQKWHVQNKNNKKVIETSVMNLRLNKPKQA